MSEPRITVRSTSNGSLLCCKCPFCKQDAEVESWHGNVNRWLIKVKFFCLPCKWTSGLITIKAFGASCV